MKRYATAKLPHVDGHGDPYRHPDGDWVRFADVEPLIEALRSIERNAKFNVSHAIETARAALEKAGVK